MLGFLVCEFIRSRFKNYGGVIVITLDSVSEKTLFSLELFDDPEYLISESEVLFKVNTSEEE